MAAAALAAFAFAALPAQTAVAASESTLTAETIHYDTNNKNISATGGVVITREGSVLSGDKAEGNTEKEEYTLLGNVRGSFPQNKVEIKYADKLKLTKAKNVKSDGVAEAFGKVRITRGAGDYLNADYVQWELGTDNYLARGRVDALMEDKVMKADEAGRSGEKFWGRNVVRYEDRKQKTGLTAQTVDGIVRGNVVQESVAKGNVAMDYIDKNGLKSVVTGDTAVYSKARGTVVVSGNARAVRSDGKTVNADSLVLHEDTRNIDAIGNSRITVIMEDKNKNTDKNAVASKKSSKKKSGGQ